MGEVGARGGRFESGWLLVVFLVCIDRLHFSYNRNKPLYTSVNDRSPWDMMYTKLREL